ncbi:hypothetical protein BV25DRAFT_1306087 [Artomyces pyxidatus]|uniref:Uncharacterized protein n=1 Tax=Artomyces pyxidatus TaxID=48021 RepID=A0ACB8SPJ8_9AGAM|nr:hypothetical protein BV25DRAFT_1306087 [Artomyces pyxidatus]
MTPASTLQFGLAMSAASLDRARPSAFRHAYFSTLKRPPPNARPTRSISLLPSNLTLNASSKSFSYLMASSSRWTHPVVEPSLTPCPCGLPTCSQPRTKFRTHSLPSLQSAEAPTVIVHSSRRHSGFRPASKVRHQFCARLVVQRSLRLN